MKNGKISMLCGLLCLVLIAGACKSTPAPTTVVPPPPTSKAPLTTAAPATTKAAPATTVASPAPTSAPFSFAGKIITIIVPSGAGGGSDIFSRLLTLFMPKYLPGKPSMLVRPMPGGESIIGTNYAYASKPDGLTLVSVGSPSLLADLLGKPAVKYTTTKMTAVLSEVTNISYLFKSGFFDKPEDIVKAKGIIFGMSPTVGAYMFVVAKELIGIPTDKVVLAYTGGGDARRAFLAGETNATSASEAEWRDFEDDAKKGIYKQLYQSGVLDEKGNAVAVSPPFPPDLTTADALYTKIYGKPPSGMAWDAYQALHIVLAGGKLLMLPPDTPDNIKRTYWDAVGTMLKDSQFLKELATASGGILPRWSGGEQVDKAVKAKFAIKPDVRAWFTELLKTKYGMLF